MANKQSMKYSYTPNWKIATQHQNFEETERTSTTALEILRSYRENNKRAERGRRQNGFLMYLGVPSSAETLPISVLSLVFSATEYASPI